MGIGVIVALIVLVLVLVIGIALLLFSGKTAPKGSSNLRSLVLSQREAAKTGNNKNLKANNTTLAYAAAAEIGITDKQKATSSGITLEKKLKYAHWNITTTQFRLIQILITLTIIIPVYLNVTFFLFFCVTLLVPMIVTSFLDRAVNNRFELFDKDYPALLLSYVSLLKTGMNAVQGLEAAAKGLDEDSLVRAEVELLIERLRLGLTEEQAINAFAEDIPHPELELFVQSLLLSRRVGGALSGTLERLAKQVRKRQQFRKQAVAVVGMEKGSSYMIALIMTLLLGYLAVSSPDLILPALHHPTGKKIFQTGLGLVLLGFFWSKQVTNIKI